MAANQSGAMTPEWPGWDRTAGCPAQFQHRHDMLIAIEAGNQAKQRVTRRRRGHVRQRRTYAPPARIQRHGQLGPDHLRHLPGRHPGAQRQAGKEAGGYGNQKALSQGHAGKHTRKRARSSRFEATGQNSLTAREKRL